MMNRRTFISLVSGSIVAGARTVEAQQAGTPFRVGILCLSSCQGLAVNAFLRSLQELGHVEGRTVVFEYRDADWKVERLPALAGELVQSKVDVIFTPWGTAAALAAKQATATFPSRPSLCPSPNQPPAFGSAPARKLLSYPIPTRAGTNFLGLADRSLPTRTPPHSA